MRASPRNQRNSTKRTVQLQKCHCHDPSRSGAEGRQYLSASCAECISLLLQSLQEANLECCAFTVARAIPSIRNIYID